MLRLITIPVSHYCEKARWALERAGLPYREEAHLQLFHYIATFAAGGGRTVPVLVHDAGVIDDSADIVRWADERGRTGLFPPERRAEVEALVRDYDERLGPAARLWGYWELLPHKELMLRYAATGVPRWQARAMPWVWNGAMEYLAWRLRMNEETAMAARQECLAVFDDVARRLRDGRRYLLGDRLTAADLTFASLAAPLVAAPQYGGPLPPLSEIPKSFAMQVEALREHPTGRFLLRLYEEERHRKGGGS
jgi:glutathione S-transferase